MYTAILAAIIALFACTIYGRHHNLTWKKLLPKVAASAVGGFFIGSLIALFAGFTVYGTTQTSIELASIRTTTGAQGVFVLGSGAVGSVENYNLLVVNADGSVTPMQLRANRKVRIYEDPTLHNVGRLVTTVATDTSWSLGTRRDLGYSIYVPVGSVLSEFKVQ